MIPKRLTSNLFFFYSSVLFPFTTGFISRYPDVHIAITCYGVVLLLCSLIAGIMYHHLAFRSKLFMPAVK